MVTMFARGALLVAASTTAIPNGEWSDSESSRGGGTVRAVGQKKLARQQDGKGKADGDNLPGASAAVGGGNNDGRRGSSEIRE